LILRALGTRRGSQVVNAVHVRENLADVCLHRGGNGDRREIRPASAERGDSASDVSPWNPATITMQSSSRYLWICLGVMLAIFALCGRRR
jgi:hypothetical protein